MNLGEIRSQIDEVDSGMISLLSIRAKLVFAASELKKDERDVRAPERVEQVIRNIRRKADASGLDPDIAERVYRTLIDCFIAQELQKYEGKNGT